MTADEAKRAGMLLTALADFKALIVESEKKRRPKYCEGRAVEVSIAEMSEGQGQGSQAYIYLDLETGKKLLPTVKTLIEDELKALGVKV